MCKEVPRKKSKSHLDKLLEAAYYYGLTPSEVTELTAAQMAVFIQARNKRALDDYKMLARTGYSAGILGSMALEKKRPKFEDVFKFPVEEIDKEEEARRSKAELTALALNINMQVNKKAKGVSDSG